MRIASNHRPLVIVLGLNAGLLALILVALISRGNGSTFASPAFAQTPPIAASGSMAVMPAQLSPNTWGCYLLDSENQTLCVYQYTPGDNLLRLAAARNVKYDRLLGNFNTKMPPAEVKDLVERESQPPRGVNQK